MPDAQFLVGRGHDLHEAHGPRPADDRPAVHVGAAAALHLHDGANPLLRHVEPLGRLRDMRSPGIARQSAGIAAAIAAGAAGPERSSDGELEQALNREATRPRVRPIATPRGTVPRSRLTGASQDGVNIGMVQLLCEDRAIS